MPTTLTTDVRASLSWKFRNIWTTGREAASEDNFDYRASTTNGTGSGSTADLFYAAMATIAGGGSSTLDLAGSLLSFFGATLTFARIKFLWIALRTDTTATSISIGNAASNQFVNWISSATATVKVLNGGIFLLGAPGATGYAVAAGTADLLKINNDDGTNSATVEIALAGSSA